jgi:AraC-like DNA-binding protein
MIIIRFLLILSTACPVLFSMGGYTESKDRIVVPAAGYYSIDTAGCTVMHDRPGAYKNRYLVSHGLFESRKKVGYKVQFKTAGRFYCFIRAWAKSPEDNGCYIHLNGRYPDNPGFNSMYFPKIDSWDWNSRAHVGAHHDDPAYFDVKEPGVYMLTLGVREIGASIDLIVLKKDQTQPQRSGIRTVALKDDPALTDFSKKKGPKGLILLVAAACVVCLIFISVIIIKRKRLLAEKPVSPSAQRIVAEQAKNFIHENYNKPIKLEDVAKSVNLSKGYLRTLFREAAGTTVNRYLLEFRLKKAHEMLETSGTENIATTAYECGFENASHFTTSFKDLFGYLPSEIRQNKAKNP